MDGFFFFIITSFAKYRISNKSRGLNDPSASRKKSLIELWRRLFCFGLHVVKFRCGDVLLGDTLHHWGDSYLVFEKNVIFFVIWYVCDVVDISHRWHQRLLTFYQIDFSRRLSTFTEGENQGKTYLGDRDNGAWISCLQTDLRLWKILFYVCLNNWGK